MKLFLFIVFILVCFTLGDLFASKGVELSSGAAFFVILMLAFLFTFMSDRLK